jgi:uncharacterized membrane protein
MTRSDLGDLGNRILALLRAGVALSASMLGLGLILWFAGTPAAQPVLAAGLVSLMVIPVARIVVSFVDSVRRRDTLLGWSTGIVLSIMILSVLYSWRAR